MAQKDPHVDHSPDPCVDLCDPCVDLCEPRGDSGTDDPRVACSDPCVAQVFLQCTQFLPNYRLAHLTLFLFHLFLIEMCFESYVSLKI